jgi:hypothetical protein
MTARVTPPRNSSFTASGMCAVTGRCPDRPRPQANFSPAHGHTNAPARFLSNQTRRKRESASCGGHHGHHPTIRPNVGMPQTDGSATKLRLQWAA